MAPAARRRRRHHGTAAAAAAAVAVLLPAAAGQPGMPPLPCSEWFMAPAPPLHGTDLNGIALPDVCFNHTGKTSFHVFVIGDWGGILYKGAKFPVPADKRSKRFPAFHRPFVHGVDDSAQMRVATQMRLRAPVSQPDYVLNMGDNFYWGGVKAQCGAPAWQHIETGQWQDIYENVYKGPGLDGKQWLGVLGNHDYGGYMFTSAWDQAIAYTWGGLKSSGRWITPSQYWKAKVHYPDFSVDYYFMDSNAFDAFPPDHDTGHNLCGNEHNIAGASCGPMGPFSIQDCPGWFARLWDAQVVWLKRNLGLSAADWQIVVTHFPPTWGQEFWMNVTEKYGVDLILTGHKHLQNIWSPTSEDNFLRPTGVVISGGGGGITSEGIPDATGEDDQYGFVDLTLSRELITIEAISHGGQIRSTTLVHQRLPKEPTRERHIEQGGGDKLHAVGKYGDAADDRHVPEENRQRHVPEYV